MIATETLPMTHPPSTPPIPEPLAQELVDRGHVMDRAVVEDFGWCLRYHCALCGEYLVVPMAPKDPTQRGWGSAWSRPCTVALPPPADALARGESPLRAMARRAVERRRLLRETGRHLSAYEDGDERAIEVLAKALGADPASFETVEDAAAAAASRLDAHSPPSGTCPNCRLQHELAWQNRDDDRVHCNGCGWEGQEVDLT